jgi:periplasmic divalent cation tolerance protein
MPNTDVRLVLTSCPSAEVAERIARALVEERLAACVTVLPGARSTYRWKDAIESAEELMCLVKTSTACVDALRERLVSLHPYEVPEVLVLPVEAGAVAYLRWVAESTIPSDL